MTLDDRFEEFARSLAGFHETWVVYIGLELGLLAALREAGAAGTTIHELADRTGCDPSMTGTWAVAAHAYELATLAGDRLTIDEHAVAVLLDQDRPEYLGGQFAHAAIASLDYEHLASAYRSGVPWTGRPDRFRASIERLTVQDIAVFFQEVLASQPDLTAALMAGIRVVDVHCGGGRWLLAMARRFPASTFVGVESEADSVARARANVAAAGLSERIMIVEADIPAIDDSRGTFDLAYFQYALHDADRSVGHLRAGWSALRDGGRLVALEWCAPSSPDGWLGLHGQFVAGMQLDSAFEGRRLPTEEELVAMFQAAGASTPGIVDLPSGATLAIAQRPAAG